MAKILVTDDAAFVRSKIRKFLEGEGYEVLEAENGQQVVDQFKAATPDLVLMDITMPVMDGIAAVAAIKASSHSRRASPSGSEQVLPWVTNGGESVMRPRSGVRLARVSAAARQR